MAAAPMEARRAARAELLGEALGLATAMETLLADVDGGSEGLPASEFFQAARSLKSAVSMAGVDPARRLAHALEDLLTGARLGRLAPGAGASGIMARAVAALKDQIEAAASNRAVPPAEDLALEVAGLAGAEPAEAGEAAEGTAALRAEDYEDMDAAILAGMLEEFLAESQERLDHLTLLLTKLEQGAEDAALMDSIFRVAHTFKGTAAFVGLDGIKETAHRMEDVIGAVRRGELVLAPEVLDALFRAVDLLAALRDRALEPGAPEPDMAPVLAELAAMLAGREHAPGKEAGEPPPAPSPRPAQPAEAYADGPAADTIRVPTARLDTLMNLVGELITSRNRLGKLVRDHRNEELEAVASGISRVSGQLHQGLLSVRLVPVGSLFDKFHGVMRNLARVCSKQVEFVVSGKETELDKQVIERIHDPLVHLLRNAVDHGIEPVDVRRALGKPDKGRIVLTSRHRRNTVVIEVGDDGGGIDPDRVKAKAVAKGMLTHEQAEGLAPEEALRLIFTPGFSTAGKVSELSGRGVGMDVVSNNVRALRGMVDVQSAPGKGTLFRIQLPLTLAVMQVLLVRVGELVYALPLSAVKETMLADSRDISTMEKSEVVFIRGRAYPLKRLASVLPCAGSDGQGPFEGRVPVVVAGLAEQRVAVAVDELLGKQEVVLKSLGEYLGRVKGIEGASVLPDGTVALVVDVSTALGRD